jgi:hypothetical protein
MKGDISAADAMENSKADKIARETEKKKQVSRIGMQYR